MKKWGAGLLAAVLLAAAMPVTAATVADESVSACDAAVDGATAETSLQREGSGCLKLTTDGGKADVTLTAAASIDVSSVKFRDGAVMLWLYADSADDFEKLNVKLLSADGKYYLWDMAKYRSSFTPGKWNRMALPFKEYTEETFSGGRKDAAPDYSAISAVQIYGEGLGASATVYVDDVRVVDYTTYLKTNHGILFFDSFELDSLWKTTRTEEATSGRYALNMDIAAARGDTFYMNSEYIENKYSAGGIAVPLFSEDDMVDLSGANAQTLDIYWKIKATGDKSKMASVAVHLSNIVGGDYTDLYSYEMNVGDMTEEYTRLTSYRSKNFSIVAAPGGQLNLKKIAAMRVYVRTPDIKSAKEVSVQIDDLMFVNSKKYSGLEDVHCVEVVGLDGTGTTVTAKEDKTAAPTQKTDAGQTAATSPENDGGAGFPVGAVVGIAAAVVVIAGGAAFVVVKKRKKA